MKYMERSSRMSREKTKQEMQEEFVSYIHDLIGYWKTEKRTPDLEGKLEGLAFSILTAIDGEAMALPGYKLSPLMADGDKEYFISRDEDYYPEDTDIAGNLHEIFLQVKDDE